MSVGQQRGHVWPPPPACPPGGAVARDRLARHRGVRGDEREQQPVQQRGRHVVQLADPGRVHAAPPRRDRQLREERPARRDEHRDRVAHRDAVGGQALAQLLGQQHRLALREDPPLPRLVEVAHERVDEPAAGLTEALPLLDGDERARVQAGAMGLAVPPPIGRAQAIGRRAEAGQPARGTRSPVGDEPLQRASLEPPVPAGRRERRHAALVRPPTEGVGVDAEQPAGLAQGDAFGERAVGAQPVVGHEDSDTAPGGRRLLAEPM